MNEEPTTITLGAVDDLYREMLSSIIHLSYQTTYRLHGLTPVQLDAITGLINDLRSHVSYQFGLTTGRIKPYTDEKKEATGEA